MDKTFEQEVMELLQDRESRRVSNDEYLLNQSPTNFSTPKQAVNYPDARKHQIVSLVKSGVRILGYGALWWDISLAASILIFAEVLGIGEELV